MRCNNRLSLFMHSTWLCALTVALCASGAGAQGPSFFTICTTSDAHGAVYVPVRVNERADASFFFDTGSVTFVSETFVRTHALETHGLLAADGKAVKFADGTLVTAAHIKIGIRQTPIVIEANVPVIRADILLSMRVTCDGILGVDALDSMAVRLNIVDRRITFAPGGNITAPGLQRLGMTAVKPVSLLPAIGSGFQVSVAFGRTNKAVMLLDTGSEFTKVWPDLARKISSDWRQGGKISVATGQYDVYTARVDTVTLGDVEAAGLRVFYTGQAAGPVSNPLGRDFLSRCALLIDFPARKLYLRSLDLGVGPSPFARQLRGEETLLPAYSVGFPYGGKTTGAGGRKSYRPGSTALFPLAPGMDEIRVLRNPPPDDASHTPVEIAVEVENGSIIVPASISGKPVRMALDTGSIVTWLTPAAAKRLELKTGKVEEKDLKVDTAIIDSLALSASGPEFSMRPGECYVGDSSSLFCTTPRELNRVDGALGLDCLAGLVVGLDLERRKLTLWPMASTTEERHKWLTAGSPATSPVTVAPLKHEIGDWYYVEARLDGQPIEFAISTRYGGCRIPELPEFSKAEGDATAEADPEPATAVPPNKRPSRFEAHSLALGKLMLLALSIERVPPKGAARVPLLGLELFRGRRVLLDFPGKKLALGPTGVHDKPTMERSGTPPL